MLWQSSQELNAYDILSGGKHSQQLQKWLEATPPATNRLVSLINTKGQHVLQKFLKFLRPLVLFFFILLDYEAVAFCWDLDTGPTLICTIPFWTAKCSVLL